MAKDTAIALTTRQEATRLAKSQTEAEENPLLIVPSKVAKSVSFFLACYAHLQRPGFQMSVAFRVKFWIESEGLTVDGLKKSFRMICRPERQVNHRTVGDLMADLSGVVADVLKEERKKEAERQWKREQADAERAKAPASEFRKALARHREELACQTIPSATGAGTTV